jgi:hypothetical protein
VSDLVNLDEFTNEFREWIESEGGIRIEERPGCGAAIVVPGGETIHYFTRIDNGWIRVSKSERGADPSWLFEAATIGYAEKRLGLERGETFRLEKGLPRLFLREWRTPSAPGKATRAVDIMREGMLRHREETLLDGKPVFSFTRDLNHDRSPAAGATWWADRPLHLIIESFKDPTGQPLFEVADGRHD